MKVVILPKKAKRPLEDEGEEVSKEHTEDAAIDSSDEIGWLFPSGSNYDALEMKPDADKRPLWVCNDGLIILEAFSVLSTQAEDFLITIAEPVSRPKRIHEFKLTAYSLYASVSVGMSTNVILQVLDCFSKSKLPDRVVTFIKDCTLSYGKVKLVLIKNKYYVESSYPEILRLLLQDESIANARVKTSFATQSSKQNETNNEKTDKKAVAADADAFGAVITLDKEDEEVDGANDPLVAALVQDDDDFTESFEIQSGLVDEVRKRCNELDYPLMEEYDFRDDDINPNLEIDLSPKTLIRDYQEKSLSKMFGGGSSGGRARSGIIVLPTGTPLTHILSGSGESLFGADSHLFKKMIRCWENTGWNHCRLYD